MLERLEALQGKFWTNKQELIEEVEELGFWLEVDEEDYIAVYTDEIGYEHFEWVINLIVAGNTIAIKDIEEL